MPENNLTTQQITDAVTDGVLESLREIGRALNPLTLAPDEEFMLESYRTRQAELRHAAKAKVAADLARGGRQTYNVTR